MRRIRRPSKSKKILICIIVISLILVGYAILNTTLSINGTSKLNKVTMDVHWTNVQVTSGSVIPDTNNGELPAAIRDANSQIVNYSITLSKPGDFYEFTVDATNQGSIDVMIGSITTKLNGADLINLPSYLNYEVSYSDGSKVMMNQILEKNHTETYLVRIEYKEDLKEEDLPTTQDVSISLSFNVSYIQKDGNAIANDHISNKCNSNRGQIVDVNTICKRATVLHQETCYQTSTDNYCSSAGYTLEGSHHTKTITYGTCGTSGTLTPGDAFDCDVNGDGQFDSNTERFYYVSGLDGDNTSNYIVLIYYINTNNGAASNTAKFAYDSNKAPWTYGPDTIVGHLPTSESWSGVSLVSTTRDIKGESGDTKLADFSYAGHSSRFITIQEISAACGSSGSTTAGYLDGRCEFLMERTAYANPGYATGYWQESVRSSSSYSTYARSLLGSGRRLYYATANNTSYYGARPVIEVLKSRVLY